MKKQILYAVAVNEDGILVKARDAEKKGKYFCPVCSNELILKKSGNTGEGCRRPHFAHYSHLIGNCTPEGVLYYSFKKMVFEKIRNCIDKKIPIDMVWTCNYCHNKHKGNLLKKVFDIKYEYDMGICKPDIVLFNEKGNVFAAIEIVFTRKPENKVLNNYKKNNIILIQIVLDSENDLDNIDDKLNNPDIVDFCFNPKFSPGEDYKTKEELNKTGNLPTPALPGESNLKKRRYFKIYNKSIDEEYIQMLVEQALEDIRD